MAHEQVHFAGQPVTDIMLTCKVDLFMCSCGSMEAIRPRALPQRLMYGAIGAGAKIVHEQQLTRRTLTNRSARPQESLMSNVGLHV